MIPERSAGLLLPLFSVRSADDLGRGDINGLIAAGELAHAMGQRLIQLLPIDETPPGEASPYSAMSVLAIDPLYISLQGLGGIGAAAIDAARQKLAKTSCDLSRLRTVKEGLLDLAFQNFRSKASAAEREAFTRFISANRGWLDDYALFRALKLKFDGAAWNQWPPALCRHDQSAVADATAVLADDVERFKFWQFLAQSQWSDVRRRLWRLGVFLGGDLAFSPGLDSAEVWARQPMFNLTRTVGAPPDAFSADGQRWGLPMPNWGRMRGDGFSFIRMRVAQARGLYDFVRIDHVVGLFRTYSYPIGSKTLGAFDPPTEAEQRAQGEELLRAILAEAGPMRVIAEDLGVIPSFVRTQLAQFGIPGYKIARWERAWTTPGQPFLNPATYPAVALATTGTHDTDTLAEWWETLTEEEQHRFVKDLGIDQNSSSGRMILDETLLDRILGALYASPTKLAILPIQDLFGWKDRINVPGSIDPSNWKWRLPFDPAHAEDDPKLRAQIAKIRALAEQTGRF
jgi:4-alpha-glucanotransferase